MFSRLESKEKPVAFFERSELIRKQRLRTLGYDHTMTLYGIAFQDGKLRRKRIEVLSLKPIKQVHNAFLYEVMVRQDLSNPTTQKFHQRLPLLDQAKFKGIPKRDYLVLTMRQLYAGSYEGDEKAQWVEYDQET